MTDEELKAWETSETDINNDLHVHFAAWGRWDWCDIAEEGRRVGNVMFDECVEENSARDAVMSAAVAHADHMAYEAMAAALGVDAIDLRIVVADWSEKQDNLPPPVTAQRLMEMVAEMKVERSTWGNRCREETNQSEEGA